jgi:YYY domain-containing protein
MRACTQVRADQNRLSMGELWLAIRWYLVIQAFAAAALPLGLRLFRRLPDRGYALSKALGLLLSGWVFWILGTAGIVRNTALGILVSALVVAFVSWFALRRYVGAPEAPRWRLVVAIELLFAVSFASWCLVRADMPRIDPSGGEKWMEIAFLQGILRSDTFPPNDPWLSGYSISYYYFGYLIVAMIARLAAVPGSIGFNLGIVTLFALTCSGAFGLAYDLTAIGPSGSTGERRQEKRGRGVDRRALVAGLLAVLLVAVMGNLEGFLEVLHASGVGSAEFWGWLDIGSIDGPPPAGDLSLQAPTRFFWWWQASRVVTDYAVTGQEQLVIDEFPAFSFILGDLHPHVLALPFVLLAIGLSLNVLVRSRVSPQELKVRLFRWNPTFPLATWELLLSALAIGGLGFLNTWDLPIYLALFVCAYLIGQLPAARQEWRDVALRAGAIFLGLALCAVVLYLPYWVGFQTQAGGILPNLASGTRFHQFFVMFGPLLVLASALVVTELGQMAISLWDVLARALAVIGVLGAAAALLVGVLVLLVHLDVIAPEGPFYYVDLWLRGEPIPGSGIDLRGWALPLVVIQRHLAAVSPAGTLQFEGVLKVAFSLLAAPLWVSLGMAALAVGAVVAIARRPGQGGGEERHELASTGRSYLLLLVGLGAVLAFAVEYVYLRDIYGDRMNTVFKFYFQVWVMWSIAGACTLAGLFGSGGRGAESRRRPGRLMVGAAAIALMLLGLVYTALAIPKRQEEHARPGTLDGAAHLAWEQPDDYAAIEWLNENVGGAPVILEAPGDGHAAWIYAGRVSAFTGLPTLLGWGDHEYQWRGSYEVPAAREPDIEALYTSEDLEEVRALLDEYGIQYVYVGGVESSRYPAAGLDKFAQLMEVEHQVGTVTIYGR